MPATKCVTSGRSRTISGAGALVVRAGVRRVAVLERHEVPFASAAMACAPPRWSRSCPWPPSQNTISAPNELEQADPLVAGVVGDHDREPVALAAGDHGEGDARVAGRRLEDRLVRGEDARAPRPPRPCAGRCGPSPSRWGSGPRAWPTGGRPASATCRGMPTSGVFPMASRMSSARRPGDYPSAEAVSRRRPIGGLAHSKTHQGPGGRSPWRRRRSRTATACGDRSGIGVQPHLLVPLRTGERDERVEQLASDPLAPALLEHVEPLQQHHPSPLGPQDLVAVAPTDHVVAVDRHERMGSRLFQEQIGRDRRVVGERPDGPGEELPVVGSETSDLHGCSLTHSNGAVTVRTCPARRVILVTT